MIWRYCVFVVVWLILPRFCYGQEELGEVEIEDYLRTSRLRCDNYMMTVKTEFGTELDHPSGCSGTEEFVELFSKDDRIVWRRARRDAKPYEISSDGSYPCLSFSKQWCRLEVNNKIGYGMIEEVGVSRDLFEFVPMKSVAPGCLVFPELIDWPFVNSASRHVLLPETIVSLFTKKLRCIDATEKGGSVVSKWSHMNESGGMWELESEKGYPSVVKWMMYPNPVKDKVPVGNPSGFMAYNKIEWQEDEYGKYPKRINSTYSNTGAKDEGVTVLEAEFKLNVDDEAFRNELARVKKRLKELEKK